MAPAVARSSPEEAWRRRLVLPTYQVQEAARYAHVAPQTVWWWQKGAGGPALAPREPRKALSYMQLIEVAVVAALQKEGVSLKRIRETREWLQQRLSSEFPFAEYRFKTDGKTLFMDFDQIVGARKGRGKLIRPDQQGQLAWAEVIGRLKEFDYENRRRVIRWRVGGDKSAVVIDPRVSFGAPTIRGTATWAVKGRWEAGEMPEEIAEDFNLRKQDVIDALMFEGVEDAQLRKWLN
jgi:uncharacterized protein (DUF433 family)